jgi:hypothetical protein
MHPEILRELGAQRDSDMRARAERVRLGRRLARGLRHHKAAAPAAAETALPAVPDYVDGSFMTEQAAAAHRAA